MININKNEVLFIPDLSPYKIVKETKRLVVLSFTSEKTDNIELTSSSQIQNYRGLISVDKFLSANSLTLSVYVFFST